MIAIETKASFFTLKNNFKSFHDMQSHAVDILKQLHLKKLNEKVRVCTIALTLSPCS